MSDPAFASVTANFELPLLFVGQSQKEFTVNEGLARIDAILGSVVEDTIDAPPAAPRIGSAYLVGDAPDDAFAGRTGQLALMMEGGWRYIAPAKGRRVYDLTRGCELRFDGTQWQSMTAPPAPTGGTVQDVELRACVATLIQVLQEFGIFGSN